MKKYVYDKLQSKIATIIRKNIKIEYTTSYESEVVRGLTSHDWVVNPSREQAMITAEKILTEIGIKIDETPTN